jgi:AcrR family transcriptional regulator
VRAVPARRPPPEERQRDPERTRQALLDAALAEFAAKGRAGARVGEIAERAGVNKQLISYYFGGKDGLYDAIVERWHQLEREIAEPGLDLDELAYRYLEVGSRQPELQKLFVRENLEQDPAEVAYEPDCDDLRDLRARQAAGELAGDLDPGFVLLVLMAATTSGVVFPGETKRLTGLDPRSPEYLDHIGEQLRRLVRHLS